MDDILKFLDPISSTDHREYSELRFFFLTDLHLHHTNPSSRKDDYPQAMLDKLSYIANSATEQNIDFVIIGGDIWHAKAQPDEYVVRVLHTLQEFQCPIYTIIGNHDIYYTKTESIKRTPLGILLSSGRLNRLGNLTFSNIDNVSVQITGLDFCLNPKIPQAQDGYTHNFLVTHNLAPDVLVDFSPDECLNGDEIIQSKYNYLLLGHDHNYYGTEQKYTKTFIRPGALSRGSKTVANRGRKILYNLISVSSSGVFISELEVPVRTSAEIFSAEQIQREEISKKVTDFVRSLRDNPVSEKSEIESILSAKCNDPELFNYVRNYLVDFGIISQ